MDVRDLALEREVALKVLHPTLSTDPDVVTRFNREAQLAARLQHPNIVDIHDIDGRGGLLWYTMELVRGPSVAGLVAKNGPMTTQRVIEMLYDALAGLEHAHGLRLVHRDVKPENMLVDPSERVMLSDFGLALALRGDGRFGGASSRSGTLEFASPEQLLGEHVDERTDLYSLAVVAYFALLGASPFEAGTPAAVIARQIKAQLPALSKERTDVRPELEAVLQRAASADPEDRYASAAEFRKALQHATRPGWRKWFG